MAGKQDFTLGKSAENGDTTFTKDELSQFQADIESKAKDSVREELAKQYEDYDSIKEELAKLKKDFNAGGKLNTGGSPDTSGNRDTSGNADTQGKSVLDSKMIEEIVSERLKTLGLDTFDVKEVNEYIKDSQLSEMEKGKRAFLKQHGVDEKFTNYFLSLKADTPDEFNKLIADEIKGNPKLLKSYVVDGLDGSFKQKNANFTNEDAEKIVSDAFKLK